MKQSYKLFGFLNMFDIIPDFTYPILEHNNKLYFQHGYNDKIEEFVEVKDSVKHRIVSIDNFKCFKYSTDATISLESKPIYAFQYDKDYMVYGTSKELCLFFSSYEIPNNILKDEILDFYKETNNLAILPYRNHTFYYYGTGRRKKAVARVYIYYGTGKIIINNRDIDDYFVLDSLKYLIKQPLVMSESIDKVDIVCNVNGGGVSGQAGAIRLGISKALLNYDESLRSEFKKAGFLTRDSRIKERKKYGLKAARKAPQHSKR